MIGSKQFFIFFHCIGLLCFLWNQRLCQGYAIALPSTVVVSKSNVNFPNHATAFATKKKSRTSSITLGSVSAAAVAASTASSTPEVNVINDRRPSSRSIRSSTLRSAGTVQTGRWQSLRFARRNEPRVGLIHSVTKSAFQNILASRLDAWSAGAHSAMDVQVQPCRSHNHVLNLARGKFQCDVSVATDRIVFGNTIRFSGGRLEIKRLRLNLWSFAGKHNAKAAASRRVATSGSENPPLPQQLRQRPRYLQQFDFQGHNLTMTQEDLFESNCIRQGLVRLLTRILTSRGLAPKHIAIESISILESSGKIAVRGKAVPSIAIPTTMASPEFSFEVRSSIGTSSRGHVVTFPGLELSLTPGAGFFVPIFPELTVDLGNHAQIQSVTIDAATKQLQLCAKVTITPEHTMRGMASTQRFQQSAQSFAAMCAVDVGRWLTKAGKFAH